MPIRQRFDHLLLGATVLQTAAGLAVLASASWVAASERYGRAASYFVTWQAATAVVGLGLLVVVMHLRRDLLVDQRTAWIGVAASWALVLAAFAQPPVASTHRWLSVAGLSLQPSVLARLALIVLVAVELPRIAAQGWRLAPLVRLGAVVAATATVVALAPDLGSAALLLAVVAGMAFVAGLPLGLAAAPAVVGLLGLVGAIVTSPYRLARVRAFLDPEAATAAAWQSTQSLIAIGSGSVLGRGYGAGLQKMFFLPEPHTDFIFAIVGEELGLLGMLALLGLATVVVWRGLRIAVRQSNPSLALLAFGLALAFALQTLVHMVVCLNLLPPKGIPLPLVSYGKTDLLISLISLGLLVNLSREVRS